MKIDGVGTNNPYTIYNKDYLNKDASKTEIDSRNKYSGEQEKLLKMADDKYGKLNKQTRHMSAEARKEYISDRYFDSSAAHYIHGLTTQQRSASYKMERFYSEERGLGYWSIYEPMYESTKPVNGFLEDEKSRIYNRNMINQQINNILEKNSIILPKVQKSSFSIDPFNYKITVKGIEDLKTKNLMELILNEGNNGRELFYHVSQTLKADSSQKTKDISEKHSLMREIKKYTGLNINELEVINNKFITKDGQDLITIYKNGVRNEKYVDDYHKGTVISHFASLLNKYAEKGIDSVPDMILKIDWQDGSLINN